MMLMCESVRAEIRLGGSWSVLPGAVQRPLAAYTNKEKLGPSDGIGNCKFKFEFRFDTGRRNNNYKDNNI